MRPFEILRCVSMRRGAADTARAGDSPADAIERGRVRAVASRARARLRPAASRADVALVAAVLLGAALGAAAGTARAANAAPASRTRAGGFDARFENRTLRVDYYHTGDRTREWIALDRMRVEGVWAGSTVHLTDGPDRGAYRADVYDVRDGRLIFRQGYDSYFREYRTSAPAGRGVLRTYHETVRMPLPRGRVRLAILARGEAAFDTVFAAVLDPADVMTIRGEARDGRVRVVEAHIGGDVHACADIAFVGEGYREDQFDKFRSDLARFVDAFFSIEPLSSHRDRFNIRGVFVPSAEAGIDEPTHGVFRRSALGCTFNSLGSERYVLTEDNRTLRDVAGHVPYDAICIMINHHRYGGGGIYNLYSTFTTDNPWSAYLLVHEFGHSFFGLADEYYTSSTAYEDFYPRGVEPAEPNITALLDAPRVKWGEDVKPGTPIPTPWNREAYERVANRWQRIRRRLNERVARLRREGAPDDSVRAAEADYERTDRAFAERMHEILASDPRAGTVGAFEGAGYVPHGLYRSEIDCIMFSKLCDHFCAACRRGIADVLDSMGSGEAR